MRGEGGMARSQNLGGVRGSSGGEVEERGGGPCRRGGDMGEVSADKREGGRRSGGEGRRSRQMIALSGGFEREGSRKRSRQI